MYYVYRLFTRDGKLLYIGSSDDPKRRVRTTHKKTHWGHRIARGEAVAFDTLAEARAAEKEAIKNENPAYNKHYKQGKDWEGGVYGSRLSNDMPRTWERKSGVTIPRDKYGFKQY